MDINKFFAPRNFDIDWKSILLVDIVGSEIGSCEVLHTCWYREIQCTQCLKIGQKVAFNKASEARNFYNKFFFKLKFGIKQCYQIDHFYLDKDWWKIPKLKNSNATFLGDLETLWFSQKSRKYVKIEFLTKTHCLKIPQNVAFEFF